MRSLNNFAGLLILATVAGTSLTAAAAVTEWISPRFATGAAENRQVSEVKRYSYQEQLFSPSLTVSAPVATERFSSPWEAFFTRISAMMRLDYSAWFSTWDAPARELVTAKNAARQQDADYWQQWWRDTFSYARFQLVRKITVDDYVLLTYRGVAVTDGQGISQDIEFPVVFKQSEAGKWLATLDLRADPLPSLAPWVTGETRVEVTVR